jgi:hypothetical protein
MEELTLKQVKAWLRELRRVEAAYALPRNNPRWPIVLPVRPMMADIKSTESGHSGRRGPVAEKLPAPAFTF